MPEPAEPRRCKENHEPPRTRSITKEFRVPSSYGVVSVVLAESVKNHELPRTRSVTKESICWCFLRGTSCPSWQPFSSLTQCTLSDRRDSLRPACIRIEVCQNGLLALKKRSLCCRYSSHCCGLRSWARKLSKRLRPSNRLSAIEFF